MPLTSTQIGAIGENLLINAVMKASDGRMSPFQPIADDDGLDVLFFDKVTGNAVAVQLKCRTVTIRNPYSGKRGNTVHFQVRQATYSETRKAYVIAGLLDEELTQFVATWFIPMDLLPGISKDINNHWVFRPSKSETSADRFTPYRCHTGNDLADRILKVCDPSATIGGMTED